VGSRLPGFSMPNVALYVPRLYRPTPRNLARLAAALRRGEIVGVPSETVYGLAANALDPAACARIFAAKGRPTTDPLIVHLADVSELDTVAVANPAAELLANAFWPGALTLVLPKRAHVPSLITAGRDTVAVRVPAHPVFRRLIRLAGLPLAAPSANPFGYISPTCAAHVRDGLTGSGLRAVLDGGTCRIGVESTILDFCQPDRPRLLRPGGIAVKLLERTLGYPIVRPAERELRVRAGTAAAAPGLLDQHYSPRTPLTLHTPMDVGLLAKLPPDEAILLLRKPAGPLAIDPRTHWLSEHGALAEVARHLFARLRSLDAAGWQRLHAEAPLGHEGLAPAIRDRLTRAAAKRPATPPR
jgi:L-threonylcarbamoyladenylate synthase